MTTKRILLVEDDEDVYDFLKAYLADKGFVVDVAINGESGVRKVGEFQPDLVILDLMMPGLDGYEFLRTLQTMDAVRRPKVIVLTAVQKVGGAEEARGLGADGFLLKPVDNDVLLKNITSLL